MTTPRKKGKEQPIDKFSEDCMPKQTAKKIKVDYDKQPAKRGDKDIHPRLLLPPVQEGKKVADKTPSAPIKIDK